MTSVTAVGLSHMDLSWAPNLPPSGKRRWAFGYFGLPFLLGALVGTNVLALAVAIGLLVA